MFGATVTERLMEMLNGMIIMSLRTGWNYQLNLKTKDMKEKPQDTATIAQTCETKQKLTTQGMFDEIIKGELKDAERINEIWKEVELPEETMKREFGNRYATVTVRHGLNTYTGKRKLKTPEGMVEVKDTLEACSSGKAASFRLETEDGFVYFPAQILKKCVFSLVVEN
jgi:hypothetical protein